MQPELVFNAAQDVNQSDGLIVVHGVGQVGVLAENCPSDVCLLWQARLAEALAADSQRTLVTEISAVYEVKYVEDGLVKSDMCL